MKPCCSTKNEQTSDRKKILMYYTYPDKIGGPLTYIHTIMNSELKEKYLFKTCFQNKAPGGWDYELLRSMVRKIKYENPEIVHVHGAQSEGFYGVLAAKLAGCKSIVLTIHGFAFDDSTCQGLKHFLYKYFVEPISIQLADKVYCVCNAASQRSIVIKNAGKRNYGHIYNPVPELKVKESRESIRKKYNVKESDVLFAITGRVTKDKGFDFLVDTVKIIGEKQIKNFKLIVLGDGEFYPEFCKRLEKEIINGQVIMIGSTDRVADYLNASDAFIFPSYHENLSIALLEAGASGLPCIVSNVGGNDEVIKDGETGFVIEHFDAEEYAEKIHLLINNPELRNNMKQKIQKDVIQRFSLNELCRKVELIYDGGASEIK